MREDLHWREYAKQNGFEEKLNSDDVLNDRKEFPLHVITYHRGKTYTWFFSGGWQVAELVAGSFRDHRPQKTLRAALDKILKEQNHEANTGMQQGTA